MKKILMAFSLAFISVIMLCSFTVDNVTLKNEEYGQSLFLYSDGTCVVTTRDGRGTGKYDLKANRIYIKWDNGYSQQGSYTWDRGLTSVTIEGVRYSIGQRVVPRPRH